MSSRDDGIREDTIDRLWSNRTVPKKLLLLLLPRSLAACLFPKYPCCAAVVIISSSPRSIYLSATPPRTIVAVADVVPLDV